MRRHFAALAALLAAASVPGVAMTPVKDKTVASPGQSMPAVRKNATLGGFGWALPQWRYSKGRAVTAAQQKRASIKRRNVRRHKRNRGARS